MNRPVTAYLSVMVSRRCNMACRHCSVVSGPQLRDEPTPEGLLQSVRDIAAAGVGALQITGGEPMIREEVVLAMLAEARSHGLRVHMTTNGFWGRTARSAKTKLKALRRAGLTSMTVSYDKYHAEFQGPEPAINIARAAHAERRPININIVREQGDPGLSDLVAPFEGLAGARLRFYDVQPVGRARDFRAATLRVEDQGFCGAAEFPAITDDGRVTACNGPAYFSASDSPLIVGDLKKDPLHALLQKHRDDPILDTIRTAGPSRLRRELRTIPGFESFPFRPSYSGLCDLCLHITSTPPAVEALRAHLAQPRLAAERVAARRVIQAAKRGGPLSWPEVNGAASRAILFHAARDPRGSWAEGAERILGRADLDWSRFAEYLVACGLSRPLLPALDAPLMGRWAPAMFGERIRAAALREGFREVIQREALRNLSEVLDRRGVHGIVLKGGVFLHGPGADPPAPSRSTGDLDVWVPEAVASDLRSALLSFGWEGDAAALRTAPHHLAPVAFRGVLLEIHTRLMPSFWGLPEQEMREASVPLDGWPGLRRLDPAGFLLHTAMHSGTTLFSVGLKAAWDMASVIEGHTAPDWNRLTDWVGRSKVPSGFWTPVRTLDSVLQLGIPGAFLARSPAGQRQGRLDVIARRRLFSSFDGPYDLNPWTKNAIFLLLHDSMAARGRYLYALLDPTSREARRSSADAGFSIARLKGHWAEAYEQLQHYRAALRAVAPLEEFE